MGFKLSFQRFWAFSCLSLSLTACHHIQAAKGKAPSELKDENQDLGGDKAQIELWSPARRKASASFFYLTGEYEAMSRNPGRARKLFESAYNLDPNPMLASRLIEMQANEDIDKALEMAQKMVLLYPDYADLRLLLGRFLTAAGNFEKAEVQLKKAIELKPEQTEAYVFLLHLCHTQQKYKEAIPVAVQMLKVNPEFSEGWAQLARLYLMTKQYKLAIEPAKQALSLNSSDPERVHLYGLALELNGDRKKAAEQYDSILKLSPTQEDLIANMIGLIKQVGSLDDAMVRLQATEKAVGRPSPGVKLQMAFVYWEQQKFADASQLLDQLAQNNPESDRIIYMAGLGQERTKQIKEALATFDSFDASSEFFVPARYRAIEILRRQGDIDGALGKIREVASSHADVAPEFYTLGAQVLAGEKRFEDAIKFLDDGINQFPERIDLWFLKAVNQERKGDYAACSATLEDLLKKDPNHAAAHNYLGYLLAERKENLDKAEFHIKKALEIKPDDGYYLDSLGWVYFQRGEFKKALEVLLKANDTVANEGVILEHIADTYMALGQAAKAHEFYGKAIKTKLDDKDRQRISDKFEKSK